MNKIFIVIVLFLLVADLSSPLCVSGEADTKKIQKLKEKLKNKINDSKAHYELGLAYEEIRKTNEAIDQYKDAIRIDPDFADAHYRLGLAYDKIFNIKSEIEQLSVAAKLYAVKSGKDSASVILINKRIQNLHKKYGLNPIDASPNK